VKTRFEDILKRIESIDKDVGHLNTVKSKLPDDKPYSSNLQLAFDKQINQLLNERVFLMETVVLDPPPWLLEELNKRGNITLSTLPQIQTGDLSVSSPTEKDVINFLHSLPKTEIHLHLEACLDKGILKQIIKKNHLRVTDDELDSVYNFEGLNGFINLFIFIQSLVQTPSDLQLMIDGLAEYMRNDNIVYAEVFFAPTKFVQNGLDFFEMMDVLVSRIREVKRKDGTDIRLLVDVSRTFGVENALKNLKNVIKLNYEEVIGIGLGGAEGKGPAKGFASVFGLARDSGLRTVAHSGEDEGPWEIWDALKILKAERIGHATSAIQDPQLLEYFVETQTPIEVCLTSNVFTGKYVRKETHHPVRRYYDMGIMTCINTDDPQIFNVSLTYEYFKLYRHLNFTIEELLDLVKKGVYSTFHPDKDILWNRLKEEIEVSKKNFKLQ
jgi:cAMP deaminase